MKHLSELELKEITFGGLLKILNTTRIYKYISFENGLQYIVKERKLKFNTPNLFNDPFDCNPILFKLEIAENEFKNFIDKLPYDRLTKRKLKSKINSKIIFDSLKHKRNSFKICCFSETNVNNLMWSHYGDYHRGLCIGFEFPIVYKNEFVLYPVNYENQFEVVKFTQDSERVVYYWLMTKSGEWSYEKEIRAINLNKHDYCTFEKSMIKEIVLGYKISNKDKDKLFHLLKQEKFSKEIEINQIEIDKKNLKLIIKSVPNN